MRRARILFEFGFSLVEELVDCAGHFVKEDGAMDLWWGTNLWLVPTRGASSCLPGMTYPVKTTPSLDSLKTCTLCSHENIYGRVMPSVLCNLMNVRPQSECSTERVPPNESYHWL